MAAAAAAVAVTAARAAAGELMNAQDLEHTALAEGERWALEITAALQHDGRPIAGGWPGTLSEARQRVGSIPAIGRAPYAELERLAQHCYASARRTWLQQTTADLDD